MISPLDGWNSADVMSTPCGVTHSDIYGKLFHYLRSIFTAFIARMSESPFSFTFYQVQAWELLGLRDDLGRGGGFSRIEARALLSKPTDKG
jgi:hypothetical protein